MCRMKYIFLICFIDITVSQYNPIPCYPGQPCNPIIPQPPYSPPPQIQLFLSPQYISASVPISQFSPSGYPYPPQQPQQYLGYPIDYSSYPQLQPQDNQNQIGEVLNPAPNPEVYQQTTETIYDNLENDNFPMNYNHEFQQDPELPSGAELEVKQEVQEKKNVSDSSEIKNKQDTSSTGGEHTENVHPTISNPIPHPHPKNIPLQIPPLRSSPKCPAGWRMMTRSKGKWCMKVFGRTLNVWDAQKECKKQGASLSGVENEQEQGFIHAQGVHILRSLNKNIQQGSVWIGGKRRTQCLGDNKNAAGCVPWTPNAFEWTDGFTSGKNMFRFRPGQPDYLKNSQEFVYMHIVDKPFGIGSAGATPGSLDDINGGITSSSENLQFVRGYVCGKPASFN